MVRASHKASLQIFLSVQVVRWVPQNDLLGHERMRAFLTHGGGNSMYESAYHGVPLIGMAAPWGDHLDNVAKATAKVC